ncbi:YoaK family protein [Aeromicrobium alkaliterrae]|uniref:DUF1275 domain-containing protein n=1 Tax=Aeromicrobium alkaliterrae TaxID=302168 RepID=A0ABP4VYS0_9ACTN
MIRRLAVIPAARLHLALMLALTFSTGVIDAVGYLGLDRVFTGNMTGNVVILGMALTGADDLPVLGPVLALAGFMAGAAAGGRVLRTARPGWTGRTTLLFAAVGAVMAAVGVLLLAFSSGLAHPAVVSTTTVLAAAMGVQAATARFLAVKDVTTVVVTSTITGLAADSVLGTRQGGDSARRAAAIVLILVGALVGAAVLELSLGAGVAVSAVVTLLVALVGHLHARA